MLIGKPIKFNELNLIIRACPLSILGRESEVSNVASTSLRTVLHASLAIHPQLTFKRGCYREYQ